MKLTRQLLSVKHHAVRLKSPGRTFDNIRKFVEQPYERQLVRIPQCGDRLR